MKQYTWDIYGVKIYTQDKNLRIVLNKVPFVTL